MIFANSPQAKGRIERANRALQDRLVKEPTKICTKLESAANATAEMRIVSFQELIFGKEGKGAV